MFFFGLFSGHIPYILLSILYLVGFGMFSVNSMKSKLPEKQPNNKIIYRLHSNSHVVASEKDICIFNNYSKNQIRNIACKNYFIQAFCLINHPFKIFKKPLEEYIFEPIFSMFSRPPPSV